MLEPITFLQTRVLPAMVLDLVVEFHTLELFMIQVIQIIMILVTLDMVMQVMDLINQVLLTIQITSSTID